MDRKRHNYPPDRDRDNKFERQNTKMKYHRSLARPNYMRDRIRRNQEEDRVQEQKRELREHMLREHVSNNPNKGPWASIGKDVKVVQCWRCKDYGHRSGDRECRLFTESQKSSEIFRFEHEDPMHKYFEERKRKEKEERVEQLKLLLDESSSNTSDNDSSSSTSDGHRKEKRKKLRKKDVKSVDNDILKRKKGKRKNKKDESQRKSKKHKKRQLKQVDSVVSELTSETDVKMQSHSVGEKNSTGAVCACIAQCDKIADEKLPFGPSASSPYTLPDSQSASCDTLPSNNDTNRQPATCISEADVQRELKRFREKSLQIKAQHPS